MAEPLQRAVGWTNQMMRELCAVWWAAACLEAAGADDGSRLLWRPQIKRVAVQPDLLLFTLRKRQGGEMRWETLLTDGNNEVRCSPLRTHILILIKASVYRHTAQGSSAALPTHSTAMHKCLRTCCERPCETAFWKTQLLARRRHQYIDVQHKGHCHDIAIPVAWHTSQLSMATSAS